MCAACGGNSAVEPDASPIDAPADVAIDADEGSGFRVSLATFGVRDPMPVTLDSGDGPQTIVVTQDTGTIPYRFPRRLAGGALAITAGGAQTCTIDAPQEVTADVVATLTCDGIVDLRDFATSRTLDLVPGFDPRVRAFAALQPLLVDADETTAIATFTPMYPSAEAQLELRIAGAAVAAIPQAPLDPGTVDVDLVVTRAGFARTYTLAITRVLRQQAYAKASDTAAGNFLGGVGTTGGGFFEGIEVVRGNSSTTIDLAGNAVAISGDTAVVGAYGRDAAYVFVRAGSGWTLQQKLSGPASTAFGVAVAIAGDTIVVGAPQDLAGAAYVFTRTGATWSQVQELRPGGLTANALFGAAVAIAGTRAVIGAPNQNGTSGAAYLFAQTATWTLDQTLTTTTNGRLGAAVAISATDLAVAAPDENSQGAVYVAAGTNWAARTPIAGPSNSKFGYAIGLDTLLVVGAPFDTAAGRARVYTRTGATWSTTPTATLTTALGTNPRFGSAIAVQRRRVAIGVPRDEEGGHTDAGSVVFFHCAPAGTCVQERRVVASTPGAVDWFGKAVAIDRETLVIGAPREDSSANGVNGDEASNGAVDSGAIYISR